MIGNRKSIMLTILLAAMVIAMPAALAAQDYGSANTAAQQNSNMQATAQNSNLQSDATANAQANAALKADAPHGLSMLWTRLRYYFASNPQVKANLGLKMAESNLEDANTKASSSSKADVSSSVSAYENALARIQDNVNRIRVKSASKNEFRQSAELDNRLTINQMQLESLRQRISANSNINASQKAKISSSIDTAEQKIQAMQQTAASVKASIKQKAAASGEMNESEASDIEANVELGFVAHGSSQGLSQAAQVNMNNTERLMTRVQADISSGTYSNSTVNESEALMAKANSEYSDAQSAYANGDFKASLESAIMARHHIQAALSVLESQGNSEAEVSANLGIRTGLGVGSETEGQNNNNEMIPVPNTTVKGTSNTRVNAETEGTAGDNQDGANTKLGVNSTTTAGLGISS